MTVLPLGPPRHSLFQHVDAGYDGSNVMSQGNRNADPTTVGSLFDGQEVRDYQTDVKNYGASAWNNLKEAGFDGITLGLATVPVVGGWIGGGLNIMRGLYNSVHGTLTGNAAERVDGYKSMVKGALYCIPGYGLGLAAINLTTNLWDTGRDTVVGSAKYLAVGDYEVRKQREALNTERTQMYGGMYGGMDPYRSMMLQNSGYGAGLAYRDSYAPQRNEGYPAWYPAANAYGAYG